MDKPLLTIGIPTYNRRERIQNCVRSILPQLNERVQLVVRDNASDYNPFSLFSEYELKAFDLQVNPFNIGADANILGLLVSCNTKWCWVVGDDDPLKEDSLQKVLNDIDSHPDVAYINYCSESDKDCDGFKEFTEQLKSSVVFNNSYFIAACVFNIEKLRDSLFYYYRYQTTMIGQLIFVLKHLESHHEKCLFRTDFLFSDHVNKIGWNLLDMVYSASSIYYIFYNKRKMLNKTMFKGVTCAFLNRISRSDEPFAKRLHLVRIVMSNYGIFRTIFYCPWDLSLVFARYIIPSRLYERMQNIISKRIANK